MTSLPLRSLACTALAALLGAGASAETFNATSRGWYDSKGLQTRPTLNTLVGQGPPR